MSMFQFKYFLYIYINKYSLGVILPLFKSLNFYIPKSIMVTMYPYNGM